jgi:DNA-binding response OmpR family regulator
MPELSTRSAVIVEADPMPKDLMRLVLTRLKWQVKVTANPGEVRNLLKGTPPDLFIVDTFLTGINGLELLRQLRAENLLERTEVMVISAFGFQEIVRQAQQLGARAFLVKPLDADQFAKRVGQITDDKQ